jgi:predicted permease
VLGLGIGATTAVLTVVNRVLLAGLPYPDAGRLVAINQRNASGNVGTLSVVDVMAIRDQQRSFDVFGALRTGTATVSGAGSPERVAVGRVTSGFFQALGVAPAYGRLFGLGSDAPGEAPLVVVSWGFAEHSLGGAAAAVGKAITIDGTSHTVVGVLDATRTDLAGVPAVVWPVLQLATPDRRGPFGLRAVARLKRDVSLEDAAQDLADISVRVFPLWAAGFQDSSARYAPMPLHQAIVGRATRQLTLFAGAVALVLLLAVANVATLLLVRSSARQQEFAVRDALGAGRHRIARLVFTECATLIALAGMVGLGLAALALNLVGLVAPGLPRLAEIALDGRSVAFALATTAACGLLASLAPLSSLAVRRPVVASALVASSARGGTSRRANAIRGALVVSEFALALPLLLGAGLLANSFLRLQRVDAGFDPRGVFALGLSLPTVRYADSTQVQRFWLRAEARALEAEGVTAAGLAGHIPPDNFGDVNNFDLLDRPVPAGTSQPLSPWPAVTDGYFAAMQIPLLDGRLFTPADSLGAPPVVVVSRGWAAKYYPGESAIGRRMYSGGCNTCPPTTVIGVVSDVHYQGLAGDGVAVYAPVAQDQPRSLFLVVRSRNAAPETLRALRAAISALDPELAPVEIIMTERLGAALGDPRRWVAVVGAFAATGTLLAAVGIFGLMSYVVRQRRREIGVRMAVGATPRSLIWLVVERGMRYVLLGTLIGLALTGLESRWLGSLLFGVEPRDPLTIALAITALLSIALLACLLPGIRAARIRPVEALSSD